MLYMKLEEPTSIDISGKTKMIRLYRKITILLILKASLSLKMYYVPILNAMIINDYTTLLSNLSPINFDMVHLLN